MKHLSLLAAALLLTACGVSDEDRLSGDMAGAEGTAPIEDAVLNGEIDADRQAPEIAEALPPETEIPLASKPEPDADPLAPAEVAPSFDCTNAWREVERDICEDPELAALDRTMAARYFRALKAADPARATLLEQTGAAFIRNRNRCSDADCVVEIYQDRIAEIAYIMGGSR